MTYRVNHVNSWNGWDPLQQVILGNVYNPSFFEDIADIKLRDLLQQILYETQEDLQGIKDTLEQLDVEVVQVPENSTGLHELHEDNTFDNVMDIYESSARDSFFNRGFVKPLISPRDEFLVLGNRMLASTVLNDQLQRQNIINPRVVDNYLGTDPDKLGPLRVSEDYAKQRFDNYVPQWQDPNFRSDDEQYLKFLKHTYQFWAPTITRVGDTLVVDQEEVVNLSNWLMEKYPQYKQSVVAIGGHNDATYCIPKPGHIICSPWESEDTFKDTFPGWDVLRIENPGTWQEAFLDWEDAKWKTHGRWWDPTAVNNPELVDFVEQWLYNWVGFSEETVFEVNMLSVDENTILSLNYQEQVHNKLKSINIEPIYCRFRHRWFWDSGLHCMTVDTLRQGNMQNYFGNTYE